MGVWRRSPAPTAPGPRPSAAPGCIPGGGRCGSGGRLMGQNLESGAGAHRGACSVWAAPRGPCCPPKWAPRARLGLPGWGCPPWASARPPLRLAPFEDGDGHNLCRRVCGPRARGCGAAGLGPGCWHSLRANGFSCCAGTRRCRPSLSPPGHPPGWDCRWPRGRPSPCPPGRHCLPLALIARREALGPSGVCGDGAGGGSGVPPAPRASAMPVP